MGGLCYHKLDMFTGSLDQLAKLHTGRASGFTGTTAQATVHVIDKFSGNLHTSIGNCLHLINTATRGVHFYSQNSVGGAGGQAEAAVNTLAYQVVGMSMAMERPSIR